jgi:hypothetical protein
MRKFDKQIVEDTIKSAKRTARDISDTTKMAYDGKRDEIRETSIHKKYASVLTPEEVSRAERAGLVVGILLLFAFLVGLAWWLM